MKSLGCQVTEIWSFIELFYGNFASKFLGLVAASSPVTVQFIKNFLFIHCRIFKLSCLVTHPNCRSSCHILILQPKRNISCTLIKYFFFDKSTGGPCSINLTLIFCSNRCHYFVVHFNVVQMGYLGNEYGGPTVLWYPNLNSRILCYNFRILWMILSFWKSGGLIANIQILAKNMLILPSSGYAHITLQGSPLAILKLRLNGSLWWKNDMLTSKPRDYGKRVTSTTCPNDPTFHCAWYLQRQKHFKDLTKNIQIAVISLSYHW